MKYNIIYCRNTFNKHCTYSFIQGKIFNARSIYYGIFSFTLMCITIFLRKASIRYTYFCLYYIISSFSFNLRLYCSISHFVVFIFQRYGIKIKLITFNIDHRLNFKTDLYNFFNRIIHVHTLLTHNNVIIN